MMETCVSVFETGPTQAPLEPGETSAPAVPEGSSWKHGSTRLAGNRSSGATGKLESAIQTARNSTRITPMSAASVRGTTLLLETCWSCQPWIVLAITDSEDSTRESLTPTALISPTLGTNVRSMDIYLMGLKTAVQA